MFVFANGHYAQAYAASNEAEVCFYQSPLRKTRELTGYSMPIGEVINSKAIAAIMMAIIAVIFSIAIGRLIPGVEKTGLDSCDTPSAGYYNPPAANYEEPELVLQSFPINGTMFVKPSSQGVCPFGINASDNVGYYIKLVEPKTDKTVVAFFVRPGMSHETDVPMGTYELRYAVGYEWIDENRLFGKDTRYYHSDELLVFNSNETHYLGHTITLEMVYNGNFETEVIDKDEF